MICHDNYFIEIPSGEYSIGIMRRDIDAICNKGNIGVKKEFLESSFPVHTVRLAPVLIGKMLVSYNEYANFTEETGYITEAEKDGWGWISLEGRWQKCRGVSWKKPFGSQDDDRYLLYGNMPVMQVSWNDAAAFCAWILEKTGRLCRLPRETEWEVFARQCGVAGAEDCNCVCKHEAGEIDYLDAVYSAVSAGRFCSTGLLWEWTEDWYDRYPGGLDNKDYGTVYKVLRGGSAVSMPVQRTREFRLRKCPTARSPYYSFRILSANAS